MLNAQISGRGEFNGLLALIAGGQVSGKLKLKLYDLGETDATVPADPQLVHQETLSSNELTGKVTTGIGFSITVEGGAPRSCLSGRLRSRVRGTARKRNSATTSGHDCMPGRQNQSKVAIWTIRTSNY